MATDPLDFRTFLDWAEPLFVNKPYRERDLVHAVPAALDTTRTA